MRTTLMTTLVMACLLPASARGEGRWRPLPIRSQQQYTYGMTGGAGEQHMHSMTRCAADPQVVYLSHDCAQVWRSDDGGLNWHKPRCEGMLVKAGQSIEVDPLHPNIVIAVADSSSNYISRPWEGVFRSTDYGESWELVLQVNMETVQRTYQHCLAAAPSSVTDAGAQVWYVAIPDGRLYRSDDAGVTWTARASLPSGAVYAVHANIADSGVVYVGGANGLMRSTDGGATLHPWGNLPSGTISTLAMHPTDPDTLWATVQGVGLYRSTDGGQTFTAMRTGDATGIFVNGGDPDVMYLVGTSSDLRVTHNGGATWTVPTIIPPLGLQRDSRDIISGATTGISPDPSNPDSALAFSHAWLSRTDDGAITFSDSMSLFTGYNWGWWFDAVGYDIADPDHFIFFCADIGMVVTRNGGLWWERHKAPWSWYSSGLVSWRGMYAGDIYPVTGSETFIASIGMYWSCKLLRSENEGDSYELIEDDTENYLFVAFNTDDPAIAYAGDKRSTDGGRTFTAIPYLQQYDASILGMCAAQPDTIYAMSDPRQRIFRSDDAGVTWRLYTQPGWSFNGLDSKPTFAVHPTDPDIIYTLASDRRDLAMFDGTTWTDLNVVDLAGETPYRNYVHGVALDPRHPNIIYAVLHAAGFPQMFRSTDSGTTWEDITYNLPRIAGSISVHPLTGDLMHSNCAGTRVFPPPYDSPDSIYPNCPGAAPIARAGDDLTVADNTGQGLALLTLDGSASTSLDEGIVEYRWTNGGAWLGEGETLMTVLPLGVNTVKLTIIDGAGVRDDDTLVVTVLDVLPGDADGDGDVDLDDFAILKLNFGTPAGAVWADGDFDEDGDVDLDDFAILKTHFGR